MCLCLCVCVCVWSVSHSPSPTSDLKPFTTRLADYLVLAKVRQALGFAKCQKNFYGAAPMTAETQHFFLGLNIRLYAGYGLSETSGPHFMSSPNNYRLYRYSLGFGTCASPHVLADPIGAHLLTRSTSGPLDCGSLSASSSILGQVPWPGLSLMGVVSAAVAHGSVEANNLAWSSMVA